MNFTKLNPNRTLFLLCDVQEKFRNAIPLFKNLVNNIGKLLRVGKDLDVPLIATEQYPKGLGNTVQELHIDNALAVLPKAKFSMYTPDTLCYMRELIKEKPQDVVLFGLETHICVLQTSIDFLQNDFRVHIVADCIASRLNQDRDVALHLLRQIGCYVQTSESVIFNLLQSKDNPKFNTVRKLVTKVSADMEISKESKQPKKKKGAAKPGAAKPGVGKKPSAKKAAPKKGDSKKAAPKKVESKQAAPKKAPPKASAPKKMECQTSRKTTKKVPPPKIPISGSTPRN